MCISVAMRISVYVKERRENRGRRKKKRAKEKMGEREKRRRDCGE